MMPFVAMRLRGSGGGGSSPPSYLSATTTAFASSGATRAVNMPATVAAGDLLIVLIVSDTLAAPFVPPTTSWVMFSGGTFAANLWQCFVKIADGTEDGTTVNFVSAASANRAVAICYRIAAGSWDTDSLPEATHNVQAANTAPDCPSLTPTWGSADALWIAAFGGEDNGTVSVYPYASNNAYVGSNPGASNVQFAEAASCTTSSNVSSLNPGTFTKQRNATSVALTMAVRPVSTLDGFPAYLGNAQSAFTGGTSHLVNMPPVVNNGDLLLIQFTSNNAASAPVTPSGWTQFSSQAATGIVNKWYYRVANGTEGGTTVDVVTGFAVRAAAITHRIKAGTHNASTNAPEALQSTTAGSGTPPNPPSLTPSWGSAKTLWIAGVHGRGDNTSVSSSYPLVGCQTLAHSDPATAGSSSAMCASCFTKVQASSLDPAAFGAHGGNSAGVTVAVRPV